MAAANDVVVAEKKPARKVKAPAQKRRAPRKPKTPALTVETAATLLAQRAAAAGAEIRIDCDGDVTIEYENTVCNPDINNLEKALDAITTLNAAGFHTI